jgi:hypothetical protein
MKENQTLKRENKSNYSDFLHHLDTMINASFNDKYLLRQYANLAARETAREILNTVVKFKDFVTTERVSLLQTALSAIEDLDNNESEITLQLSLMVYKDKLMHKKIQIIKNEIRLTGISVKPKMYSNKLKSYDYSLHPCDLSRLHPRFENEQFSNMFLILLKNWKDEFIKMAHMEGSIWQGSL